MNLSKDLDLNLAWQRHKKDLVDMSFSDHPYETKIIDNNLSPWLETLSIKLQKYTPSRCEIVNVPKKGFHLRPGSVLSPEDATVYQALLLKDISKIQKSLLWSAARERFSYILLEKQKKTEWFSNEYRGWANFRKASLSYISKGFDWVVFADISGYFENISIQRLLSDLRGMGIAIEIINCLSGCLNRWAEPRYRGIPQGNRCSFILGEVYLNSVDKRLMNKKIKFCRYVDDIRIFCKSKNEAISALHFLTILLREKELNLQTAKSYIKSRKEAKDEIDNISLIIENTEKKLTKKLREILKYEMDYATPAYIEKSLESIGKDVIKFEAIRKIFDEHIVKKGEKFDKTIFHYCINRLGAAGDDYGVKFCLEEAIINRPEEFVYIIPYLNKLEKNRVAIIEKLINIFENNTNILDRHYFLLLRWVYNEKIIIDKIVELCRYLCSNPDTNTYTKHYAWAILGEHGDLADLDAIEAEYNKINDELSKATILCSINKMVEDRRNSIYARAIGDGNLVKYAIKISKS